jgi:hypothetical protein
VSFGKSWTFTAGDFWETAGILLQILPEVILSGCALRRAGREIARYSHPRGYACAHERTFAASSGSDACAVCSIIFHCLLMSFSIWGWRVFWAQFELELCVYIHSIPFYWTVEKYPTYASQIFDAGLATDFEPWIDFVFKSNLTGDFLEFRIHPSPCSRLGGPSSWLPWQSRVQSQNSTWIGTALTFSLNSQSLSFLFCWAFC